MKIIVYTGKFLETCSYALKKFNKISHRDRG